MHRMTESDFPAVGKSQPDTTEATTSPTKFGELVQTPDIVPRQSQIVQVTAWQRYSQIKLGLEKCLADNHKVLPMPAAEANS